MEQVFPGQYIEELRNDVRHAESELELAQEELEQAINERDQLKTRTIMQFIAEVQKEQDAAASRENAAYKESNRVREENNKLREQIDMWGRLNHV